MKVERINNNTINTRPVFRYDNTVIDPYTHKSYTVQEYPKDTKYVKYINRHHESWWQELMARIKKMGLSLGLISTN